MECKDGKAILIGFLFHVLIETLWNVKIWLDKHCSVSATSINRNIVECKDKTIWIDEEDNNGINRNIVECKVLTLESSCNKNLRINRNIVVCKAWFRIGLLQLRSVLIETLWNVKFHSMRCLLPPRTVLIETLWNVKLEVTTMK